MTLRTDIGNLELESGEVLADVQLAYSTWGQYDGSNAVLILHALTGDAQVTGEGGWWSGVVGPGRGIDTDRFFVVAANILGGCQGSTGPSSTAPDGRRWGSRFPELTVRDQVAAEVALSDRLGVTTWRAVIGGSAGGMRALEWAIIHPDRVDGLFLLATCAAASADQIALSTIQNDMIRAAGPIAGLDLARRVAHFSYRSEAELDQRFGRRIQDDGRFAVESYLQYHGEKLVKRFDADSYIVLTDAMNGHDIGRGRGGVAEALSAITARTVVAGIDSDRLYPLHQQQELADGIATCDRLDVIDSLHGHDGFLIEADAVGALARRLLS